VRLASRLSARSGGFVVACLAALAPAMALAQATTAPPPAPAEGTVVAIEKDDVVVDLGATRGVADNDLVEIWRPLRVKHPVTGKLISDRFLIGRLRLVQVRPSLSLAKPDAPLSRAAEVGDVILFGNRAATAGTPAPTASECAPAAPLVADDEASALSKIFDSLRGADIMTRVRAYETYIDAHPQGRYARVLWEESQSLRKLLLSGSQRAPVVQASETVSAEVRPLDRVVAGEPLRVAVALRGAATGAVLHARPAGQTTYSSEPMDKVGPEYWAATIPGPAVQSPALEWFVEAVAPDGTHPVAGEPTAPESTVVEDVRPQAAHHVLGEAKIWTDYASFNARANNDYAWQTEGLMGARFDDVGIRAVRTGFGVYRGVGGSLQQLDVLNQPGTPVGLTYGYLEGEFGLAPTFSILGRAVVGLQADGVTGGASAFLRIGSDLETNLLVGGEVLGGIGVRGIAEFDWNSFRAWPIMLRSEVTNQPAGVDGDVGVRLIGQVGYRVLPHLVIAARASYQGRTINHAGPGGGAAVEYAW
jgi:hypothetical protein